MPPSSFPWTRAFTMATGKISNFKVKNLTLTVLVLVTLTSVCCAEDFPLNFTNIREKLDALTESQYLLFPHVYRAFIDAGKNGWEYNVSEACGRDLRRYYLALNSYKAWAWRFYDATGKQGAGLFMGAVTWKGNLQECLNTLHYKENSLFFRKDPDQPQPKYCSVFLQTPDWLVEAVESLDLPFPVPLPSFIADVCVPAQCSRDDLSHIVQKFVSSNSRDDFNFTVTHTRCFPGRQLRTDPAALFTIIFLLLLAGGVIFGTIYDILLRRSKLRVKRGPEFVIGYKKDSKQYGILKVILAPPTKEKLRRRNTIGGYEKPDKYELSEIKVNRQTLLSNENKSSVKDGAPHLTDKNIPPTNAKGDGDQKGLYTIREISPDDNTSGTTSHKDIGQNEATNQCSHHISLAKETDAQAQRGRVSNRVTDVPIKNNNQQESITELKTSAEESDEVFTDVSRDVEKIVKSSIADPAKNFTDNSRDEQLEVNVSGKNNNALSEIDSSDMKDLSGLDPEEKNQSSPEVSDTTQQTTPQPTEQPDIEDDPSQQNISSAEENQTAPLLDGTKGHQWPWNKLSGQLSSSDPGSLNKVHPATDMTALTNSYLQQEIEVKAPEKRSSSSHAARYSQSKIHHTPALNRQGSVFERQMSVSSDDSGEGSGSPGVSHALYAIPEECPEKGTQTAEDMLLPEVVVRDKPGKKAIGLLRAVILSFSFRRSTKRIMAEGSVDTLFCLNGIRVLSISWIVLGNTYMILYLNPDVVDNHVDGIKLTQKLWVQVVINTTLAADSFFILSGTLGAYNFFKMKKNKKGKSMSEVMTLKEYGMMIIHRLVRIGPCYWLVMLTFTNLMPYMGKGPRWNYEVQSVQTCKDQWWANAFFFSNFYRADNMCMPHTYYLVNDFQFALLSPLFLIPLLCMPELGFIMLGGVVLIQIMTTLILDQGINGNVLRMSETGYFSKVYVKPYCRMGVYAIGLGLGYILFATKRQLRFKRIPLVLMWVLSLAVVVTLPFITHLENRAGGRKWTGIQTAFYEALSRPLWGLALAWIIFACSTGQGAFINKLLSWNAFLPLCRITYGVYLLHPMLIAVTITSRHNGIFLDFGELSYEFVGNLVVSYLLAFILITFVECPFASLKTNVAAHLGQKKKS